MTTATISIHPSSSHPRGYIMISVTDRGYATVPLTQSPYAEIVAQDVLEASTSGSGAMVYPDHTITIDDAEYERLRAATQLADRTARRVRHARHERIWRETER